MSDSNLNKLKEELESKNWVIAQTGGNCIVFFKDMVLKNGNVLCVGLTDECIVIYNTLYGDVNFGESENEMTYWSLCNFVSEGGQEIIDILLDDSLRFEVNPFEYYKVHFASIPEFFTKEQMTELILAYKLFTERSKEWIRSDDMQFIRKIEERTYEAVQIIEVPGCEDDENNKYTIASDTICLDNYNEEQITKVINAFSYISANNVKEIYGAAAADQIIAECIFETYASSDSDTPILNTAEEALTFAISKFNLPKDK